MGCVWELCGPTFASLSPSFSGVGAGSEVMLEQVQLNFSTSSYFITVLPCGLLLDDNTNQKCAFFEHLITGNGDVGGYENQNGDALIIIKQQRQ